MAMQPATTRTLRDYQHDAVTASTADLSAVAASQLHMACGTGKTLVELRIAEQVAPGEAIVVVAVPTVALVDQMLRDWRADATLDFTALAVCSDETAIDAPVHLEDLTAGTTTDPKQVADWITGTPGRRYLVTTYLSAPVVAEALHATGLSAHLLMCDEAHHLTGRLDTTTRRILDRRWPSQRRLFATATPRVDLRTSPTADYEVASMDDPDMFGPVSYTYPFAQAIKDGWLKDYHLAVIGVSTRDALRLLSDTSVDYRGGVGEAPLQVLAAQIALLRAHTDHGVRRVITFHARIAEAHEFARTLAAAIARIDDTGAAQALTARHVNGQMDTRQRGYALDALRHPPAGGWAVVSNARCLGEGVDLPAVDCVVFGHPKRSPVDIVQAVGRAIRRSVDGADVATIVVPIIIDDHDGATADLDSRAYRVLWQVVRALRAHDEELGIALDTQRAHAGLDGQVELPDKISVVLPPGTADHVLRQIKLMLVERATSSWWEGYGAALRFHAEHGHLRVPRDYVDATGFALGPWISNQRHLYGAGGVRLPADRKAAMDALGMLWHVYDALWLEWYELLEQYKAAQGHVRVPADYVTCDGRKLGGWMHNQLAKLASGRLRADRAELLAVLGAGRVDPFSRGLQACDRYLAKYGHLDVPDTYIDETGFRLGAWITRQRGRARGRKAGNPLTEEQRAALNERGMVWAKSAPARDLTAAEARELRDARAKGRRNPELTDVVVRLFDDGVPQAQIAEVLGVGVTSISYRVRGARQRAGS